VARLESRLLYTLTANPTKGIEMLTGEIRSQIDTIWNAFWTGGISNPLEVIEQITYLLFLRRLDEYYSVDGGVNGAYAEGCDL
jgi:HsdM N-terminal domain